MAGGAVTAELTKKNSIRNPGTQEQEVKRHPRTFLLPGFLVSLFNNLEPKSPLRSGDGRK